MSELKERLEKRIKMKKKKPVFIRKDAHGKKRLKNLWRRPRGLHNKRRLKKGGHAKNPSTGYGTPRRIKGLHKTGLIPVIVSNFNQLNTITKEQGIILSSKIGDKKRHVFIIEIKKRGFVLLNLDADKTVAKIESKIKARQAAQKKKLETKKEKKKGIEAKVKKEEEQKKKKEEEKKEKVKEKEKPELTEEERKKLEKQEKDKLLTKKT